MNAPLPESIRKALETVTLDDKYSLDYGQRLHERRAGAGAAADAAAPARCAGRARTPPASSAATAARRWAATTRRCGRPRSTSRRRTSCSSPASTKSSAPPRCGARSSSTSTRETQEVRRRVRHLVRQGPGRGPLLRRLQARQHGRHHAKHGGVIAIAGDDHVAKSSTAAHQSDHIFKACGLPVFFPSQRAGDPRPGPARLRDEPLLRRVGRHEDDPGDRRIQRHASSVDPDRVKIVLPEDFVMPPGGVHIRWPDAPLEQEARLFDYKWYAALAYVRANRLNHNVIEGAERPLRHHRQRQGLQRHPPGAARPGPGRRRPAAASASACTRSTWCGRWKPTITREFARACRRSWSSRRSARSSSTS